ncbi:hypothetical protein LDC_0471, partial [sediment metagenome]
RYFSYFEIAGYLLREFPKLSHLTGAVHFSQKLLKVLREFPKLSHYYTILGR